MDDFDNIVYSAINNYFHALTKLGYLNDKKVNQLLLLIFLEEFLTSFQGIITEKGYNIVDNLLTCLQGTSCLVPYSKYILSLDPRRTYNLATDPVKNYLLNIPIKLTEDSDIKTTEDVKVRLPNQ